MSPSSSIVATMTGVSDECANDNVLSNEIVVSKLTTEPYSDGIYTMTYVPTVAGSYVLSTKLVTRGGLLATYYKTMNLTNPVLASLSHLHDGKYYDPYWCDGLQSGNFSAAWKFGPAEFCDQSLTDCGCDSALYSLRETL
jgi:hypothetical protein